MRPSLRTVVLLGVVIALGLALLIVAIPPPPASRALDESTFTTIEVVDAEGKPIPSAIVQFPQLNRQDTADAQGRVKGRLARGAHFVRVFGQGYVYSAAKVTAPGKTTVRLEPESVIEGRVVQGDTLDGVPNAYVLATGTRIEAAQTNARGMFRIGMLPAGQYALTVRGRGWAALPESEIQVDRGQTERVVIRARPALSVSADVTLEETGAPCTNAYVVLRNAVDLAEMRGDEKGRVVIDGLLHGRYSVDVHCGEFGEAQHELQLDNVSQVGVRWSIPRPVRVRGTVLDGSGAPKVGVRILSKRLGSDRQAHSMALSDASGHFEARVPRGGDYELVSTETSASAMVRVGDADIDGVVLREPVVPRSRLEVLLVTPDGRPLPRIRVALGDLGSNLEATSAEDGRFQAEISGRYASLRIADGRFTFLEHRGVAYVPLKKDAITSVRLKAFAKDGVIRGRVLDESREAFPGVAVVAMPEAEGEVFGGVTEGWVEPSAEAITDSNGTFELTGLPSRPYRVRARTAGGGQAIARDARLGSDLEMVLRAPSSISGRAIGPHPMPRLTIAAVHLTDEYTTSSDLPVANGFFTLSGLPAGRYRLTLRGEGVGGWTEVDVEAGQHRRDVEIPLRRAAPLSGRVVSAVDRKGIAACSVDLEGEPKSVFLWTGLEGDFEIRETGAGPRRLRVECAAPGETSYCGDRVEFELSGDRPTKLPPIVLPPAGSGQGPTGLGIELRSNEVTAIRPSSSAAQTELRVGDRIVEVRGFDVRARPTLLECLLDADEGESVSLRVERGPRITILAPQ